MFYYSPESHETAPLVQALLTDDWQAQWPLDAEALAPVAAMFNIIMRALGEMSVHNPAASSFSRYAQENLGPLAGYITGWTYCF
ncbi:hypothetical protein MJN51_38650, partial [Salmonella enterica subsp. enterica serovar Kentucky]|nr:hypothetical protein [Salmonella enterica subsp. enterica serovar Kentucky]